MPRRDFADTTGLPIIANGMGRGVLPRGHSSLVTRARGLALKSADLVVVVGTPLDFRLGYGVFGDPASPAAVIHIADSPESLASPRAAWPASIAGDLSLVLRRPGAGVPRASGPDRRGPVGQPVAGRRGGRYLG